MDIKTRVRETGGKYQETSSQRILLEEYRSIYTDYLNLRTEGVNRVNFFITAMSVLLGGVLLLVSGDSQLPLSYFKLILLSVSLILAIIGLEIYNYLIHRTISSDRRARGLARIRNYFVQLDPQIKDLFVSRIYDTPSTGLAHKASGLRRTIETIVGVLIGVIFAVLSTFLLNAETINLGIGIGITILAIFLLEISARRRLNKALQSAIEDIKFKKDESSPSDTLRK